MVGIRHYCTYFDRNYCSRGIALYQSLKEFCSPFKLWILCFDNESFEVLSSLEKPEIQLIRLTDFEFGDSELTEAKKNRSRVEYYFTCTPSLPLYVFKNFSEVDSITYLDADLYFLSDPASYFSEIANCSIAIVEHRYPDHLKWLEKNGIYNVGILYFRNDQNGRACLSWWREKCIEWCHDYSENDLYADQKYLDVWPKRFSNVHVVSNTGINVAPWNIENYTLTEEKSKILVDNSPIIVFHFHGLKQIGKRLFDPNLKHYGVKNTAVIRHKIYIPYLNHLKRIDQSIIGKENQIVDLSTIRSNPFSIRKSRYQLINFLKIGKKYMLICFRLAIGKYFFLK